MEMEWVKFFVESYVQLIGYIAWPLVALIILLIFRKAIVGKMRGLIKVSKGDTIAEFINSNLQEKLSKKLNLPEVTQETYNWDSYLDALEQWAAWISFFQSLWVISYIGGNRKEADYDEYNLAIKQLGMVIKKIREERPNSKILKTVEYYQDCVKTKLEEFERNRSMSG